MCLITTELGLLFIPRASRSRSVTVVVVLLVLSEGTLCQKACYRYFSNYYAHYDIATYRLLQLVVVAAANSCISCWQLS